MSWLVTIVLHTNRLDWLVASDMFLVFQYILTIEVGWFGAGEGPMVSIEHPWVAKELGGPRMAG